MTGVGARLHSFAPQRTLLSRYIEATRTERIDHGQATAQTSPVPGGHGTTQSRSTAASESLSAGSAAALAAIGLAALAAGVLVYLADRDAARTMLIPTVEVIAGSHLFGAIGQWLPSFVHPFAFALFTAATYPARTSAGYVACVAWWVVNAASEVAQHPGINRAVAETAERVFGASWPGRLLSNYVLRGTFDVGDLIAATGGAVAAASVLYLVHHLELSHEH